MAQVPFAFEFEFEWQNSRQITIWTFWKKSVQWLNDIQPFDRPYPNLANGNLATILSLNYHSAVQTQTRTQTELEVFRKHDYF